MDKVLSDKRAICLFIIPSLLLFSFIIIAPIIISVQYSTLDWDGMSKGTFVGFDNYYNLFFGVRSKFPQAVTNSLLFAAVSIFIQLPFSLLLALVISNGVKFENFYRCVYFIPVIISTVVIGQLWMKIYHPDYGLLNMLLRGLGLDGWTRSWLGTKETALMACFVPILWQYIGYHMLLYYGALKSISPDIYEAARIDGASGVRTAFSISIPLIKPMIKTSATFSLIGSLKVFDLIFVLTNGGPASATEVPSTLMYKTIFRKLHYGEGSTMAIFIILECIVMSVLLQRLFKTETY